MNPIRLWKDSRASFPAVKNSISEHDLLDCYLSHVQLCCSSVQKSKIDLVIGNVNDKTCRLSMAEVGNKNVFVTRN